MPTVTLEDIVAYSALAIGLLVLAGSMIKSYLSERGEKESDKQRNSKRDR